MNLLYEKHLIHTLFKRLRLYTHGQARDKNNWVAPNCNALIPDLKNTATCLTDSGQATLLKTKPTAIKLMV